MPVKKGIKATAQTAKAAAAETTDMKQKTFSYASTGISVYLPIDKIATGVKMIPPTAPVTTWRKHQRRLPGYYDYSDTKEQAGMIQVDIGWNHHYITSGMCGSSNMIIQMCTILSFVTTDTSHHELLEALNEDKEEIPTEI